MAAEELASDNSELASCRPETLYLLSGVDMLGTCELCSANGPLLKSHLELPAFVSKRLRGDSSPGLNPNPVMITSKGVLQTSKQSTQYLLCNECENTRFNKLGERWVAQNCLQVDDSFPLKSILGPSPAFQSDKGSYYETASMPSINHHSLEYFAASMLWHAQFVIGGMQHIRLGPYDQAFREYLLEKSTFPRDTSLAICIRDSEYARISSSLAETKARLARSYIFLIPGLVFMLTVGRDRGDQYRSTCFVHEGNRRIFSKLSLVDALSLKLVQPALDSEVKKLAAKRSKTENL